MTAVCKWCGQPGKVPIPHHLHVMDAKACGHDFEPSPAVPEAQTVPIPRWKWTADDNGDFYMERWGSGDWVTYKDHAERIARAEATIAELKDQLRRINESDELDRKRLRGNHAWHPIVATERPDILAWRLSDEEEWVELLVYNNALCSPIGVMRTPSSTFARATGKES